MAYSFTDLIIDTFNISLHCMVCKMAFIKNFFVRNCPWGLECGTRAPSVHRTVAETGFMWLNQL